MKFREALTAVYREAPCQVLPNALWKTLASHKEAGFRFVNVNTRKELARVTDLINRCYDDFHVTTAIVKGWTRRYVFDPGLWIWIIDEASEGPLECIQILPAYRRRGLGQAIVQTLLWRLHRHVAFTTVTGRVDNRTHPETLYRRCGFKGDDIWWVLKAA